MSFSNKYNFNIYQVFYSITLIFCLISLDFSNNLLKDFYLYSSLMISCSIFLYFVFWIINKNKINVTLNFVFIIVIVSRLIVLPMNPTLSDDAYRFLWDGRLIVNNVNPYKLVPSDSGLKNLSR